MDKGPWTVEYSEMKRMFCLQSDDFEHDVRLYITGDFADDNQRRRYANWLARKLNRDRDGPHVTPAREDAE